MTKQDLIQIFQTQLDNYQAKTNRVVMLLTDPTGPHIHVANADELEDLALMLDQYAYTNPGDPNIPRFTHLTCIDHDSE